MYDQDKLFLTVEQMGKLILTQRLKFIAQKNYLQYGCNCHFIPTFVIVENKPLLQLKLKILLKKVAALWLMSLIILIYLVKAFHTHAHSSNTAIDSHNSSLEHHCSICDYDFIKDSDGSNVFLEIQDQQFYNPYNAADIAESHYIPLAIIFLRGPPTLA